MLQTPSVSFHWCGITGACFVNCLFRNQGQTVGGVFKSSKWNLHRCSRTRVRRADKRSVLQRCPMLSYPWQLTLLGMERNSCTSTWLTGKIKPKPMSEMAERDHLHLLLLSSYTCTVWSTTAGYTWQRQKVAQLCTALLLLQHSSSWAHWEDTVSKATLLLQQPKPKAFKLKFHALYLCQISPIVRTAKTALAW